MNLTELANAINALEAPEEIEAFLCDICSPKELAALVERWRIAQVLEGEAVSYRVAARLTGASTTTIARVAKCLRPGGHDGYRLALTKSRQVSKKSE